MAGNLRAIADLEAEITAEGFRGITKQQLLDTLQSLAKVGGTLSVKDNVTPFTVSAGFNRIDVFDTARDTQGVQDGLNDGVDPGSWFQIKANGAGDYTVNANVRFSADTAGTYALRVGIKDGITDDESGATYRDGVTVPIGVTAQLVISGGIIKGLKTGDKLYLELMGENGANVTIFYGQFGIVR
jgi:hypothetical protein